jgi:hypothetical protein
MVKEEITISLVFKKPNLQERWFCSEYPIDSWELKRRFLLQKDGRVFEIHQLNDLAAIFYRSSTTLLTPFLISVI